MMSATAVVARPWKPLTTSAAGRGMVRRMAWEISVMASLREFEEKPGAARAGDGRGQPPVREHHIERGEGEAPQPCVRVVRLEAISLAEGVQEIGQGHRRGYHLYPVGQDGNRIVDAGEHHHEVHRGPRRRLCPRAEEHHEAAHEDADHQRGEKASEEVEGERAGFSTDEG